jgi:hypothetical protein
MTDKICKLENDMTTLLAKLTDMTRKIDEIYYAPGMPGFVQTEADFHHETCAQRMSQLHIDDNT